MQQCIHVHAMAWNEERFLPYFLRHYLRFAERIFIYDNESDDQTVKVAKSFPRTEVRVVSTGGEMRDDVLIGIKNDALEISRGEADWVMAVDVDELIWHRDMQGYLGRCAEDRVGVIRARGFNMIANRFPDTAGQVYEQIKTGTPSPMYSKPAVFAPARVRRMNFHVGGHQADPLTDGAGIREDSEIVLLHYALMGLDYVLERYRARGKRLSQINRQHGWSEHFGWSDERLTQAFNGIMRIAKPLVFLESPSPDPPRIL